MCFAAVQRLPKGELIDVDSPFKMPDADKRIGTQEPFVRLEMLTPQVHRETASRTCCVEQAAAYGISNNVLYEEGNTRRNIRCAEYSPLHLFTHEVGFQGGRNNLRRKKKKSAF